MRVLIVDDHPEFRRTAARFLGLLGYEPVEAGNAQDAEQALQAHEGQIDMVMLDVCLQGQPSGHLADALCRVRPGLPVLFMSGYPREDVVTDGMVEENRAFIEKPFSVDALAEALGRLRG